MANTVATKYPMSAASKSAKPREPMNTRTSVTIVATAAALAARTLTFRAISGVCDCRETAASTSRARWLVIAAVGLYSVVAYDATQRVHEMGVRMALCARPPHVMRLTLGDGHRGRSSERSTGRVIGRCTRKSIPGPRTVSSLVQLADVRRGQFHQNLRDPGDDEVDEFRAFRRCCSVRIANARVVRDLRPSARRPRPLFTESLYPEAARRTGPGLGQGKNQLRCEMQHDARLQLAGMVAREKELLGVHHLVPVHAAQQNPRVPGLQFADHLAEVVTPVPVDDHQLGQALLRE